MTSKQIEALKGLLLTLVSVAATLGLITAEVAPALVVLVGAATTVLAAFLVKPGGRK